MEKTNLSETLINFHQTARRHITQVYSGHHKSPLLTEYVITAKNEADWKFITVVIGGLVGWGGAETAALFQ
jgi:hypothetical protein